MRVSLCIFIIVRFIIHHSNAFAFPTFIVVYINTVPSLKRGGVLVRNDVLYLLTCVCVFFIFLQKVMDAQYTRELLYCFAKVGRGFVSYLHYDECYRLPSYRVSNCTLLACFPAPSLTLCSDLKTRFRIALKLCIRSLVIWTDQLYFTNSRHCCSAMSK